MSPYEASICIGMAIVIMPLYSLQIIITKYIYGKNYSY